jgi:thioredoxin 2
VAPVLDELARDYAGRVRIAKLNVDENPSTSGRFEIRSIPTMILFKHGREVDRLVGALPRPRIEQALGGLL